jgi:hypothetical protein
MESNNVLAELESFSERELMLFYEALIHEFTITNRAILYDEEMTDARKVTCVKNVNEAIHWSANRLVDLQLGHHTWSIQGTIDSFVELSNRDGGSPAGMQHALESSLWRVRRIRESNQ